MNENNENCSAFVDVYDAYGKKIKSEPRPSPNIGIETGPQFFDSIIRAGEAGSLDMSSFQAFTSVSQSRDQIYSLLDTMCEDSTVAAILETYAEDATEYAENGHIVWAESSDPDIAKYVSFLLDSMRVDKNVYKWTVSLCKYGDLYLRLYRQSEYDVEPTFNDDEEKDALITGSKKALNEDIKIKAYSKNDHYVHYLEMVPNPASVFELTKFGKTYAYVKTDVTPISNNTTGLNSRNYEFYQYKFKKNDVDVYNATDFVHACLEDNTSRTPEEVKLFLNDKDYDTDNNGYTYTVKRGQSLLYNTFKIWRELALLENSILLNRITKSSITRVISVEVGDMPKEMVGPHLQGIKQLIEQKAALDAGKSLNEYTNPGPVENNIYVPTKNGVGNLVTQQIGGDVNIGQLSDLDYFQDKFFGAMRVPKQYFGITDDNAGFSGGQSLSIISSRYAKMVKRIQNTITQVLTDAVNLMLLDKNLNSYINKFKIKMMPPTTQEEIDRRENLVGKVGLTTDIMGMLGDIEDPATRLEILKDMLSGIITETDVIDLIQQEVDRLRGGGDVSSPLPESSDNDLATDLGLSEPGNIESEEEVSVEEEPVGDEEDVNLPTPEELEAGDLTDNNNPEV